MDVVIAGAGIAGLTLGGLLARDGARVRIFEQSSALEEVGAGLQISANAGHVLAALGLSEAMDDIGKVPDIWRMRLHDTGEVAAEIELGSAHEEKHGQPYHLVHRAGLQRLLKDRFSDLAPDGLTRGIKVAGFDEQKDGVTIRLSDGRKVKADLLIGADGIRSTLRNKISEPDRPVYSGSAAWRGIVPAERLPSDYAQGHTDLFMGPGRHIVIYRVRHGGTDFVNFVAPVECEQPSEESWTTRHPWEELRDDFAGWHDDVQAVISAIDKDACYRWALNVRPPVKSWHTERAVLIGDAAHPTLPYIAQGAAMAIEDAGILSRFLNRSGDFEGRLEQFEDLRSPRTNKIVNAAHAIQKTFHGVEEGDIRRELQSGQSAVKDRDSWLYNYNPMTVPLQ